MTIKGPNQQEQQSHQLYQESQEQTIRPVSRRMTASKPASPPKVLHQASRSAPEPAVTSPHLSRTKSPPKSHFGNKFELPPRPGSIYREQSSEDYSDLFSDDDSVFDQKVHQAVRKVRVPVPLVITFSCESYGLANRGHTGRPAATRSTPALPPVRPYKLASLNAGARRQCRKEETPLEALSSPRPSHETHSLLYRDPEVRRR